jgi:hypothetical protein
MPAFFNQLALWIAARKPLMWLLIVMAALGLPAFGLFKSQVGIPGFLAIAVLWFFVLVLIWFRDESFQRQTPATSWLYALALDGWLITAIAVAANSM